MTKSSLSSFGLGGPGFQNPHGVFVGLSGLPSPAVPRMELQRPALGRKKLRLAAYIRPSDNQVLDRARLGGRLQHF